MSEVKTIIVLGNARSGTSMTAGILHFLGVNLNHKHQPNSQNPNGAFESVAFNSLTGKMHQELNAGHGKKQIRDTFDEKIKEVISKNESPLWGWKSAATHWTLDLILPHIKNPRLVIVTRNITHNAESWVVHMRDNYGKKVTFTEAMNNMVKSTAALMKAVESAKAPKCWTTYEDIKKCPEREATKFAKFIGIEVTEDMRKKINEFIMPSYTTLK